MKVTKSKHLQQNWSENYEDCFHQTLISQQTLKNKIDNLKRLLNYLDVKDHYKCKQTVKVQYLQRNLTSQQQKSYQAYQLDKPIKQYLTYQRIKPILPTRTHQKGKSISSKCSSNKQQILNTSSSQSIPSNNTNTNSNRNCLKVNQYLNNPRQKSQNEKKICNTQSQTLIHQKSKANKTLSKNKHNKSINQSKAKIKKQVNQSQKKDLLNRIANRVKLSKCVIKRPKYSKQCESSKIFRQRYLQQQKNRALITQQFLNKVKKTKF